MANRCNSLLVKLGKECYEEDCAMNDLQRRKKTPGQRLAMWSLLAILIASILL